MGTRVPSTQEDLVMLKLAYLVRREGDDWLADTLVRMVVGQLDNSNATGEHRCGACGELGHNVRTCEAAA